jgi:oxygen-independent coproporphyrinogen-3 oxidase
MRDDAIRRYADGEVPRYTSYPTAPHFSTDIGPRTYSEWLSGVAEREAVSLYLHIPFCKAMCWYCGCHTNITGRKQPVSNYLELLRNEIEMVAERAAVPLRVGNVHFGGGTPTIVEPEEFMALTGLLHRCFHIADTAEVAIEIDPRTLAASMAQALGAAGVGRASLGVQSFDPVVQRAVNRIQSEEQTAVTVGNLRAAGVKRINFDLIYGLPHQTVRSCIETAAAAIAMRPDRFAVFGYAHVPSFKKHQRMIDEATLPDGHARMEQSQAISEVLRAAGYRQIGLDHFALPEDELAQAQARGKLRRNFQGYTTDQCETLIGLGASAIGRMREGYVQNELGLGGYAGRIASGSFATAKGYRLSPEDYVRSLIIERLMCDFMADIPAICSAYGFDPARLLDGNARLAELADDHIIDVADGIVRLRGEHRFLIRAVAAAFDTHLAETPRAFSKAS